MPERERIVATVEPVLTSLGLELFDVQLAGSGRARTVRVVVDRDGGVDLDAITAASERVQPVLDELDDLGPFALEVSSPGLERSLARPEHFRRAVGETISVKVRDGGEARRIRGPLLVADERGVTVGAEHGTEHLDYDQIVQARTVFEWGAAPTKDKRGKKRAQKKQKEVAR